MDGKLIEQVREILLARWRRSLDRTGHSELGKKEQSEVAMPQAEIIDIAQALEQIGRDSSIQEAERRELVAVERALAKMATGTFGVCEDCGEEIPPRRLLVLPEARLCAHCQTFEERQNSRTRASGMAAR